MRRVQDKNSVKSRCMEQALEIAFSKTGLTSPNPPVGAVIQKKGKVIAAGGTGPFGFSHAEVMALEQAGDSAAGAEMFVTLEPCCHYGKTPPCTQAIINAGISRVYIPLFDPNPRVAGKGAEELRNAGVDVEIMHDYSEYASHLIRPFKKYILRHRPFLIYKNAITLDGRIATLSGDSRWISSDFSRYIVHRLRALVDAVIVGKNTFITDSPSLSVRLDSADDRVRKFFQTYQPAPAIKDNFLLHSLLEHEVTEYTQPLRVCIGLPEKIDPAHPFLSDDNYIIFERRERAEEICKEYSPRESGKKLNLVLLDAEGRVDEVHAIMEELAQRGIMLAMLEGGGRVAGSFLDAGEIDQFIYFIAPRVAGNGIPSIESSGTDTMAGALGLNDVSITPIGNDLLYSGYSGAYNFEIM